MVLNFCAEKLLSSPQNQVKDTSNELFDTKDELNATKNMLLDLQATMNRLQI